jgi:ubiquitin C-terminal hydrolase
MEMDNPPEQMPEPMPYAPMPEPSSEPVPASATQPPQPQPEPSRKGIAGLTNIGNTCYGNAVIQALRHQVDLTLFFLQENHKALLKKKPASDETRMVESYGELVFQTWSAEAKVVETRPFWRQMIPVAMKKGFEQFRAPIAHDAHEFLMLLMDTFHEALAEKVTMTFRKPPTNPIIKGALDFWKSSFEKKYSPLVELVFGIQHKSVKCTPCNTENTSWETMNTTELCVQKSEGPVNLLDLMSSTIYTHGTSEQDVIDEYACEKCKPARTKAIVTRSLWRLGNWVIIVLKRNENNGRRINTLVDIPLTTTFSPMFHPASEEPSARDSYDLFATVHHHGFSGGGHYTCHAKHSVTGKWIHYDDERAYPVDTPRLDPSTYIVMYRRRPSEPAQ